MFRKYHFRSFCTVQNQMFLLNELLILPLKGKKPCNRAKNTTPKAQISALSPLYSYLLTISGAIYDGVPQNILTFLSKGKQVEKPRSISLGTLYFIYCATVYDSSSRIFSSFISRWHIDFECIY